MGERTYEGDPLDGTMEYISEKDFEEESERLESPGDKHAGGDLQTADSLSSDLTKGQKIAKVCAQTGITDTGELHQEIRKNREFEVSKSYVSNVLNGNVDIDGFSFPDDGDPEFEQPVDKVRQAVLRIGRLNQNEDYRTIHRKCREQGLDVTYNYVWQVVSENTPKEKVIRDGSKKRTIIRTFNETEKTGSELLEEVRRRGCDVSRAMFNKAVSEISGYEDAKPKSKKEKIREIADEVEFESHRDLAEHIREHEGFDTTRHYVSEALREARGRNTESIKIEYQESTGTYQARYLTLDTPVSSRGNTEREALENLVDTMASHLRDSSRLSS